MVEDPDNPLICELICALPIPSWVKRLLGCDC